MIEVFLSINRGSTTTTTATSNTTTTVAVNGFHYTESGSVSDSVYFENGSAVMDPWCDLV